MKLNKQVYAVAFGLALFTGMVAVVGAISVPKAPEIVSTSAPGTLDTKVSVEQAAPVILASSHSIAAPQVQMAVAKFTMPDSIPVPCPIWFLGQITGYHKTTVKTADGSTPNPKLVPGAIWFMQKFTAAATKTL